MDRFIVFSNESNAEQKKYLKSNMDRFIGIWNERSRIRYKYLKSNMDRFIAVEPVTQPSTSGRFKIQYG